MNYSGKLKAFTLTDLVIALAVIGILVALVIPVLMPIISKAKGTEAQLQLEHVHTLEKSYFYVHSKYSGNLSEISFEQAKLTTEGGNANFKIEVVEATNNTFKVRATSVTDFDGDGVFNVWEVDQEKNVKEITPD